MLTSNATVEDVDFSLTVLHELPPERATSAEEIAERRTRRDACDDACARLFVESYPIVALVIAALDTYRAQGEEDYPYGDPQHLDRLLQRAQSARGQSVCAHPAG
jgi:hypothetical protein